MARLEAVREAVSSSFRNRRLWAIQFVAYPILFLMFTVWLRLPVENKWQLAWNAALVIAIAAAMLVLQAGTLNYFRAVQGAGEASLRAAFLRALRNLLAIAVWAVLLYLLWTLFDRINWDTYRESVPAYLRSILPAHMRRHVSLPFLTRAFGVKIFAVQWILMPGLLLPLLQTSAELGFRGFGKAGFRVLKKAVFSLSYWLVIVVAVLLGVVASAKIMSLTPNFDTSTLRHEAISVAIRLTFAYLLGLFSWMLACSLLGRVGAEAAGTDG